MPANTPVTKPDELTVATAVLLLLHAPPVLVVLNEVVVPGHTILPPVIAAGADSTVAVIVLE